MQKMLLVIALLSLSLFPGTVMGAQKTPLTADKFEIVSSNEPEAAKPKFQAVIEFKKAVIVSKLADDTVYVELKIHNLSKQGIIVREADFFAACSIYTVLPKGSTVGGSPYVLNVLGRFPAVIKADGEAVFLLPLNYVSRCDEFSVYVRIFKDQCDSFVLKKRQK